METRSNGFMVVCLFTGAFTFLVQLEVACGAGFLTQDTNAYHAISSGDRYQEFQEAMAVVQGCGSKQEDSSLAHLGNTLRPMWDVLPKSSEGRVEWPMLRYLAHRYFMQRSSLLIRGLEPAQVLNASQVGMANVLTARAPTLVESILDGKQSRVGFSFEDSVALVAALERVIFDSESTLLGKVWGGNIHRKLGHAQMYKVIEAYVVNWFVAGDEIVAEELLRHRALLGKSIPHWSAISHFVKGIIEKMRYSRTRSIRVGHGLAAMSQTFSFDDAHDLVGEITKTFASFWESECQAIKTSLVALDRMGTGRISLKDFYGANADGEWRFGESESYLRELGALDETSSKLGPQVIIPNYLLGASNCIVATEHYFVCCVNECEDVLNEVEAMVGAPVALPDDILRPLREMTNFHDEPLKLTPTLITHLQRIAETHQGKVPLHGRLFAQWLHYVMPRECPFPHKTGVTVSKAPMEFQDHLATEETVNEHARARDASQEAALRTSKVELEEAQLMSQWSEDEELIVDYSLQLRAPWAGSRVAFNAALLFMVSAILATSLGQTQKCSRRSCASDVFGNSHKLHFV